LVNFKFLHGYYATKYPLEKIKDPFISERNKESVIEKKINKIFSKCSHKEAMELIISKYNCKIDDIGCISDWLYCFENRYSYDIEND
jgi:hypothetical protein